MNKLLLLPVAGVGLIGFALFTRRRQSTVDMLANMPTPDSLPGGKGSGMSIDPSKFANMNPATAMTAQSFRTVAANQGISSSSGPAVSKLANIPGGNQMNDLVSKLARIVSPPPAPTSPGGSFTPSLNAGFTGNLGFSFHGDVAPSVYHSAPGDHFAAVAQRFGTTPKKLLKANFPHYRNINDLSAAIQNGTPVALPQNLADLGARNLAKGNVS